jgi:hypothetical protein
LKAPEAVEDGNWVGAVEMNNILDLDNGTLRNTKDNTAVLKPTHTISGFTIVKFRHSWIGAGIPGSEH